MVYRRKFYNCGIGKKIFINESLVIQNALSDTMDALPDVQIDLTDTLNNNTESDLKKNARKSVLSQGS